jgi:hypothetical protein
LATTERFAIAAAGRAARRSLWAEAPRTLLLVGATSALRLIGADPISRSFTATRAWRTGRAFTNVPRATVVTPPGAVLFAYRMFRLLLLS